MNKFRAALLNIVVLLASCAGPAATPATVRPTQTAALSTEMVTEPPATAVQVSPLPMPSSTPLLTATPVVAPALDDTSLVEQEMRASFAFFWEQANTQPGSPGFGLIRDRYPGSEGVASIASVGFGLTALAVGVEKGYITRAEGAERANGTLDTLLALDREHGFYYHFLDMQTGKRAWNSEVSSIDTSLLLMGVLSAGDYFGGETAVKAKRIYDAVDWPWFLDKDRQMFYMAYRPEKGLEGYWDFYAEQLMMYVLAAGSPTHPVDSTPYYTFTRHEAAYGQGKPFIHSWFGSLSTYQYSHAWIDFRGLKDKQGVDWFENSVVASQAQVQFATDEQGRYKTIGPDAWGLTACDGPDGYNGLYGAPPSGFDNKQHVIDDTVPPSGALGSIIFTPEDSLRALRHYAGDPHLQGKYGLVDAYNLSRGWYDSDVIGIDKGVTLLMLANYQNDLIYKTTMKDAAIQRGLNRLQITPAP